jgi:hypothetical protein
MGLVVWLPWLMLDDGRRGPQVHFVAPGQKWDGLGRRDDGKGFFSLFFARSHFCSFAQVLLIC